MSVVNVWPKARRIETGDDIVAIEHRWSINGWPPDADILPDETGEDFDGPVDHTGGRVAETAYAGGLWPEFIVECA